jgi:hypothetical protein
MKLTESTLRRLVNEELSSTVRKGRLHELETVGGAKKDDDKGKKGDVDVKGGDKMSGSTKKKLEVALEKLNPTSLSSLASALKDVTTALSKLDAKEAGLGSSEISNFWKSLKPVIINAVSGDKKATASDAAKIGKSLDK